MTSTLVPKKDRNFVLSLKEKNLFKSLESLSIKDYRQGKPSAKIRLVGPAGCGKTSMASQFAAIFKRPLFVIDCQTLREPLSLFGNRTVDKEGIKWVFSQFVKAIRTPRSVVLMDEANRVAPNSLNTALPLLDHRGKMFFDEAGEEIKVAAGVTFFATLNEGSQYTGTEAIDAALKERFGYILNVDYLTPKKEEKMLVKKFGIPSDVSQKLVRVANVVREKQANGIFVNSLSTRVLETAAELWNVGKDKTLNYSIANQFPDDKTGDSERNLVIDLLKGVGFKL